LNNTREFSFLKRGEGRGKRRKGRGERSEEEVL
jgi:hypothetical protein